MKSDDRIDNMGFSVLMSVYNKEKSEYLQEAIDSIFNQTLVPDEVVLIKDGILSDKLEDVIENCIKKYPQIFTFQFDKNVQLGRALAKGVELCKNEMIARMDSDDIAMPNRFEKQYNFLNEHPEIDVCGGWLEEFNDDNTYTRIKKMPEENNELIQYAKFRNPLNHMTVMFRKSAVVSVGNYCHFPLLEDYELWNRVIANGSKIYNIQEVLVYMRVNDSMYDRRGGKEYFQRYLILRKKQKKLGNINSLEYILSVIITLIMTLQPSIMRKSIYQKLLRK